MKNESLRITDSPSCPDMRKLADTMGTKSLGFWKAVTDFIDKKYPEVFSPEWIYGGKKHGWVLRYKKNKSFCTLVPEKNSCKIVIVFGAEEREKTEKIKNSLSRFTADRYDSAETFRDGKWLLLTVDSNEILKDIEILLNIKRKIKI
ncbi:MAG: DUF3788 domain-containing protein [Endomicrobiaceae bacterium]|nr:DUF3788 domain-containing protein [Endomicrobiaceae bacterium]